jgi:hypothetical protein
LSPIATINLLDGDTCMIIKLIIYSYKFCCFSYADASSARFVIWMWNWYLANSLQGFNVDCYLYLSYVIYNIVYVLLIAKDQEFKATTA